MRVAVYARVSDDQQREKQTIESQLAEVCQFAKENHWPLEEQHLYIDDGHSGFYLDRPALDRLRDAARDGLIDLLLGHDPDRLSRRYAYQVLLMEELQRWGVEVRFLKQPPPDSPEQRLLVQIQGAIAEYERARIMERTRRGATVLGPTGYLPGRSRYALGRQLQGDLSMGPSILHVAAEDLTDHLGLGRIDLYRGTSGTPRQFEGSIRLPLSTTQPP